MDVEKIVIGISDYSRDEIGKEDTWTIGTSAKEYLETIDEYESNGYTVKFETNFFRKIFGFGKYKVVAYKNI